MVLEQATEMREVGAGVLLWPNAMRVLQGLELGAAVEDAGAVAADAVLRSSRGAPLGASLAGKVVAPSEASTVVVHRGLLQTILLAALDQRVLRLGAKCVGVAQNAEGVTISLDDGSTEHGDLVVGADGLHSQVRTVLMGMDRPATPATRHGVASCRSTGHWPIVSAPVSRGAAAASSAWPCSAAARRTGGRARVMARVRAGHRPRRRRRWRVVSRLWHEPIPELIDATLEQAIVRSCQYDRPPLRRWSAGRVGLLGDAAHPMLASLGQGACQAIEDAAALGDAVGAGSDATVALRAYGARRAPHAAAVVRRSHRVARLAHLRHPLAVAARDALLRLR